MKLVSLASLSLFAMVGLAQTPAPKPAPAKPAAAKPAAAPSPVDSVIQSVKMGLSENLIIKTLQRDNKPMNLTPGDLVKLKNAGVSENIIGVMLDPASAPAPAAVAAPAAAPAPPPPPPEPVAVSAPPPAALTAASAPGPKETRHRG